MKTEDKIRRYETYIKSAQSSMAIVLILNIIYIVRLIIKKEFSFFFSVYSVEYMLKSGGFFGAYNTLIPKAAAIIAVVLITAVFVLLTALTAKKESLIKLSLGVYLIDTAFLIYGAAANPFGDITESVFVDIIFHSITLLLLTIGVYAERKLRKSESLIHKSTGVN